MDFAPRHNDFYNHHTDQYTIFTIRGEGGYVRGGTISAIREVRARDLLGLREARDYVAGLRKLFSPVHTRSSDDQDTIDELRARIHDLVEDAAKTHRACFSALLGTLLNMKVKHPNQLKVEFGQVLVEAGFQSPFSIWF